jgi:hypothetical protein
MNDQSLDRANAFLAAVAARVAVGEVLRETPAEIGRELDLPDPLSTARAVRALIARRRLEPAGGSYRLLDTRPLDPGERESVGRRPRRKAVPREAPSAAAGEAAAYSDLGRAVADKLIELGRENAELRAEVRQLREETRDAKAARDDAERRARSIGERSRELEHRAEMAEANLRSLLAAARAGQGSAARASDAPVGDAEMEAILGVLRGGDADDAVPASADGDLARDGGPAAGDATGAG